MSVDEVDEVVDNPLAEGLARERRAPPGVLVVFGASGDLTTRKLMPALERLSRRLRLLPKLRKERCRAWCSSAGQ